MRSVPSPTNTVQTAPLPATAKHGYFGRAANNVEYEMIDPSLPNYGHPLPFQTGSFPTAQDHVEQIADPLDRFQRVEGPWHPMRSLVNTTRFSQGNLRPSRQGPCSDVGSNVPRSDSGYYTRSVLSIDPSQINQEVPSELVMQSGNLNVASTPVESQPLVRRPSDQRSVSQHSTRSANQRQPISCEEPGCPVISKCNSDHKYVASIRCSTKLLMFGEQKAHAQT